jgi:hypothetical protein
MSDDQKQAAEKELFIANSVYPEADPIFTFRLKPLKDIKDDCHVVLDTNALLVPYTISRESLEQIRGTCGSLVKQKRLVIPGQVAREFAKHRATKLGELYQQLSNKRDSVPSIQKGVYPLLEPFEQYQASLQLEDQVNTLLREYRDTIGKILEHIRTWNWDDPVSLLYSELFAGEAIVDIPFDEAEILRELEWRKRHSIPPGYKDSGVGDLLIWKTILQIGKTHKSSVVFVSGDEKADWYHQSNRQPLYPRYELVDEFRRHSEGQSLHIIRFSSFLDLYGASAAVVQEVRKEEVVQSRVENLREEKDRYKAAWIAKEAVLAFLKSNYPDMDVTRDESGNMFDYVVSDAKGKKRNVSVSSGRRAQMAMRHLSQDSYRDGFARALRDAGEDVWMILVGVSESEGLALSQDLRKLEGKMPPGMSLISGYLGAEGELVVIDMA